MWCGFEPALVKYLNAILREWDRRGKNSDLLKAGDPGRGLDEVEGQEVAMPPWMGMEALHSYHRYGPSQ